MNKKLIITSLALSSLVSLSLQAAQAPAATSSQALSRAEQTQRDKEAAKKAADKKVAAAAKKAADDDFLAQEAKRSAAKAAKKAAVAEKAARERAASEQEERARERLQDEEIKREFEKQKATGENNFLRFKENFYRSHNQFLPVPPDMARAAEQEKVTERDRIIMLGRLIDQGFEEHAKKYLDLNEISQKKSAYWLLLMRIYEKKRDLLTAKEVKDLMTNARKFVSPGNLRKTHEEDRKYLNRMLATLEKGAASAE